ncbi:MAG: two component transcriptional regulator, winged helix family [Acidobacteria bacterium]|nr:two component transcriptional regulator, winged helix family [Acidobacteriota bacterium]
MLMNDVTAAWARSRVLVVDDQADIARMLTAALASQGYEVQVVSDGRAALARFTQWRPGLVMTDLHLPVLDGLALCRTIRTHSLVPIIVVSAKSEEAAKVEAFDSGADDYVTTPFGTEELLARVRATLRRAGNGLPHESFEAGDFRVDMEARRVHVRAVAVRLTPKEFDLFVYLARHPNHVLSHRTLLAAVWGSHAHPEYLRIYIGQLRKKLELMPSNPRYLLTEPCVGYTFRPRG